MQTEIKEHLTHTIIPFWEALRDDGCGGYYGFMDFDGNVDRQAVKGCILNSRITWFFANAYKTLGDPQLLAEAAHGFAFMEQYCIDREKGGIFWSVKYDGTPEDTTKHTYNQAFAIYALSSYYDASGDKKALQLAEELYEVLETKCRDEEGYLEAFDRSFCPVDNDKLSENGVTAERTMNTLLHVLEAYTEFYRVTKRADVAEQLKWILDILREKIYNPKEGRLEVFFDRDYHSLIDLYSYGHDIETAWLVDRTLDILNCPAYTEKMSPVTRTLTAQIYKNAFDGHSLSNECERGKVDTSRIWWVQAEAVVGFLNGYQKDPSKKEYLAAAGAIWDYICRYLVDSRPGMEWFWFVDKEGNPSHKPIVEPWKCPYHNGRMCMEVIRRGMDVA